MNRPMFIKCGLLLIVVTIVPMGAFARITKAWTYQELFEAAEFVVIAKAVSTRDTDERTVLGDVEPPVSVIGLVTEFETRVILKGPPDITTFKLHHYRHSSPDGDLWVNAPNFVRPARHGERYLLFLTKERDGQYAPAGGQIDPAMLSVLELPGGGAD